MILLHDDFQEMHSLRTTSMNRGTYLSENDISLAKADLRRNVLSRISSIDDLAREEKSRAVAETLLGLPQWKRAGMVMAYYPMQNEVNILPVIRTALREAKLTALPRIYPEGMKFHVLPPNSGQESIENCMEQHPLGFLQPIASLPIIQPSPHIVTIMLVPGVSFDAGGNRLGRGKGYYDSYLNQHGHHIYTAGICFSEQIEDSVPTGHQDKKIRALISDSGILYS